MLVDHFSRAYCGTLAYEGAHVIDATERAWLAARAEEPWHLDAATQHTILHDLIAAGVLLESLLCLCLQGARWPGMASGRDLRLPL